MGRLTPLRKSNSYGDWTNFKSFNVSYNRKLTKYNAYVEKQLLEKKGLEALFKILKHRVNDKPPIGSNDSRAITDQGKADMLANCFAKVFTDPLSHHISCPTSCSPGPWFYRDDIVNVLNTWTSAASINPDGIPFVVVKNIIVEIAGRVYF